MYQYTEFDKAFVRSRAAQFRDQLERWQAGKLSDEELRPLRLQNGWYIQRYAPMARISVPYGELSSAQLRALGTIARDYDRPDAALLQDAQDKQLALGPVPVPGTNRQVVTKLTHGYGHFTTRTNVQFNWIPITKAADVMELLAGVNMHGIQTSGNAIRNITTEALAGIATDEIADPRPFAEIIRQWAALHPEFVFLPRKFKIALNGATEDRAALGWYDISLQALKNDAGELGFKVLVGGGMGRTPVIGTVVREFVAWQHVLSYLEACIRVYNQYGRRDNIWKARIKILVKSEGQRYIDKVEEEFRQIVEVD
ncbi:MAG: nitrite/sulfite reductase, partial [Ramlibacter sp.]